MPNSRHVRQIRIRPDVTTDKEATKIIAACQNATSIAIYSDYSARDGTMQGMNEAILSLFEEGKLDTIGFYSPTFFRTVLPLAK